MTMFRTAIAICGLSIEEAAKFLKASVPDVEGWCDGTVRPPGFAWIQVSALYEHIKEAANAAADLMEQGKLDPTEGSEFEVDLQGEKLPFRSSRLMAGVIATLLMGQPSF